MVTQILMVVLCLVGLAIALPAVISVDTVKNWFKKKVEVVTTSVATPVEKLDKARLAIIVQEWEGFADILVANGMKQSVQEMKALLGKIVTEYRVELNKVDVKGVGMVDSILEVTPAKKDE